MQYSKFLQKIAQLSLFMRILLFYTVFSLMAWGVVALLAWQSDARHVKLFLDTQMVLFAKTLNELDLTHISGEVDDIEDVLPQRKSKPRNLIDDEAFSFAVFSEKGKRLLSDDDDGKDFPFIAIKGFHKVRIDDDSWRIFVFTQKHSDKFVIVGQERKYRQEMAHKAFFRHLIPWLILLPLFLIGLGWLLHKELKPLRILTAGLQKRKADDTSELTVKQLTPETRPLVQSLNALFGRMSSLLQRERAFVSNAAHELRTPLAGLRVQAEVMQMCADDALARDNALHKILQGSLRCSHLVEQLLLLSSVESFHTSSTHELVPISWETLMEQNMAQTQHHALEKNIHLQWKVTATPKKSLGFSELWAIALRNILNNAVNYTAHGGQVRVLLFAEKLCIENTTAHLLIRDLEQLGQRFYRPSQRPTPQDVSGSGLGLAIVQHIVSLHGAKLRIENSIWGEREAVKVSILFGDFPRQQS